MFNKRRNELEIMQNILNISLEGAKKTEILYKNNMSFSQLNNYLDFLMEKEIINLKKDEDENGKQKKTFYVTTKKGEDLLGEINSIMNYFE